MVLGRPERSSLYKAHIENYCCMPFVSGDELLAQGIDQAKKFGAVFNQEDCMEIIEKAGEFSVKTESGKQYTCHSIILTLGISRNKLNVPGESAFKGAGVSYCVECDANFFKNKPVAVIGNGSAAVSGSMTLLSYASEVHLIAEKIDVVGELEHVLRQSPVRIHEMCRVKEISGTSMVDKVSLHNGEVVHVNGVFIELGAKVALELAGMLGIGLDDEFKHIAVNKKQETNLPGIYAAGDICGPPWQLAKSIGEGCVAGIEAAAYVKRLKKR
jgi:thioredoxin reductase (NADPH)